MTDRTMELQETLRARLDLLHTAHRIGPWRFDCEPEDGWCAPRQVRVGDTSWLEWEGDAGPTWMRADFSFPADIAGIPVAGTRATFESHGMLTLAVVMVDGNPVLDSPYWAEIRAPQIVLSESVNPGEAHEVAIRFQRRRGVVQMSDAVWINYDSVEEVILDLGAFLEELNHVGRVEGSGPALGRVGDLWYERGRPSDWDGLRSFIAEARELFLPFSAAVKENVVHLVGHAHIDMNWQWDWADTMETCRRDFDTMTRMMEEFPEVTFSQSQAVLYQVAEEHYPDIFDRVREAVRRGQWDITASTWVEGDFNMASGEALVRQILHAKRYIADRFGVEPRICWIPDSYGHPTNMPQLLKKAGIDYYYFTRCSAGKRVFWWEGPDGSRLLAFSSGYNNFVKPERIAEFTREAAEDFGLKNTLFVYGVGDHGGGPTRDDVLRARYMQKLPGMPTLRFGGVNDYFDAAAAEGEHLPVFKGEMNFTFPGSYTTHVDVKRWNRDSEGRLADAEALSAVALRAGAEYPAVELDDAWKKTLFNQFHDIFCGSAIHGSYDYSRPLAESALAAADAAARKARRKLAPRASSEKSGLPLAVFNTLAWERDDVVRVDLPAAVSSAWQSAVDGEGRAWPVQMHGGTLYFTARGVPPLGCKVFHLSTRPADQATSLQVEADSLTLHNDFWRLRLDDESGIFTDLYDLREDRQVFGSFYPSHEHGGPVASNVFQVLKEMPLAMSAWMLGRIRGQDNLYQPEEIAVTATGPVLSELTVRHRWGASVIEQRIRLYDGLRRIDMPIAVDWRETGSMQKDAPLLKLSFTPFLGRTRAVFESPFGWDERLADGREMPAQRWLDMSDDDYGVSLLNDCKYGFDVNGNTMRMSIVRSPYFPDPEPDTGRHDLICALYPHPGGWREAETVRRGYELNSPLTVELLDGEGEDGGFTDRSFLSVGPSNIVVSAFKKAEEGDDLILRFYEAEGRDAEAVIKLNLPRNPARAVETDLMERPVPGGISLDIGPGGELRLPVRAWEIRTLRLQD